MKKYGMPLLLCIVSSLNGMNDANYILLKDNAGVITLKPKSTISGFDVKAVKELHDDSFIISIIMHGVCNKWVIKSPEYISLMQSLIEEYKFYTQLNPQEDN